MAKIIRFPLKMKNGAEVRTLEELRENFDLESVVGYFTDGKLQTWLANRYYDKQAKAVGALSADLPDLNARICEILGVEYQAERDETDLEAIQRNKEKFRILSELITDRAILDHVELVAMTQDELFEILDSDPNTVYLYGERFEIPFGKKNVRYVGIVKAPEIVLDKGKTVEEYKLAGIVFENVTGIEPERPSFFQSLLSSVIQAAQVAKVAAEVAAERGCQIALIAASDEASPVDDPEATRRK